MEATIIVIAAVFFALGCGTGWYAGYAAGFREGRRLMLRLFGRAR